MQDRDRVRDYVLNTMVAASLRRTVAQVVEETGPQAAATIDDYLYTAAPLAYWLGSGSSAALASPEGNPYLVAASWVEDSGGSLVEGRQLPPIEGREVEIFADLAAEARIVEARDGSVWLVVEHAVPVSGDRVAYTAVVALLWSRDCRPVEYAGVRVEPLCVRPPGGRGGEAVHPPQGRRVYWQL